MRTVSFSNRAGLFLFVLVAALAACRPTPPAAPPAPSPEVATPAEVPEAQAGATSEGATSTKPVASSSAASKPRDPELTSMALAQAASSKLGVPVDLHYQFDAAIETGRPVTLHLAAVPRVAGSNLSVSIKEVDGIQVTAGPLAAQKASAATAYRQQQSVTRLAGGPAELRVLVTMDVAEGSAFSYFSVPLAVTAAQPAKRGSVEQR